MAQNTVRKKPKVGITGNTGRSGQVLEELLSCHPLVELAYTESSKKSTGSRYETELMFLALPSQISLQKAPELIKAGKRVIDLSRAYRLDKDAVYGLPEKNRQKIKTAKLVSNPGCYATSVISGLLPIISVVERAVVVADSGISGAGEYPKPIGNIKAYKTGKGHDHVPEMEKELGLTGILFAPRVIENIDRGIISTIYAQLKQEIDAANALEMFYMRERFINVIRLAKMESTVETHPLIGTNNCEIHVWQQGSEVLIHSVLDNLMKGAAGQAVQNMNIMYGFGEGAGLPP
jgi:N-acetyl-gamma-glutamyl-phosphate reductase